MHFFEWLNKHQYIGIILLRVFIGVRLVYGVIDNVFSWERMQEFERFLQHFNFPFPLASAIVSVYLQLFAGIGFIIGWKVRIAAILMILNFLIAIMMVHFNDTIEQMTPALSILFISVFLLFNGGGRLAIDKKGR